MSRCSLAAYLNLEYHLGPREEAAVSVPFELTQKLAGVGVAVENERGGYREYSQERLRPGTSSSLPIIIGLGLEKP